MKKLTYSLMFLIPVLLVMAVNVDQVFAQEADVLSTTAVEVRGDAEVEEVTDHEMINEVDAEFEAPAYKSDEEGERAAARYVKFDNYSNLYIRCYVNGVLQGTMAPWGSLSIYLPSSQNYRFYAVAPFRDAPDKTWGGITRYVSGAFTWQLYP